MTKLKVRAALTHAERQRRYVLRKDARTTMLADAIHRMLEAPTFDTAKAIGREALANIERRPRVDSWGLREVAKIVATRKGAD